MSSGELPEIQLDSSFTYNEGSIDLPLDPNGFQTNRFITVKDLLSLQPNHQINDACIDGFIELLRGNGRKDIFITSIYFPRRILSITGNLKLNDSAFKYPSLEGYSKILFPFLHQSHYTLYSIDLIENRIDFYDPFDGDPLFPQFENLIRSWCQKVDKTIQGSNFIYSSIRCPSQHETNDCGIVMILNLLWIIFHQEKEPIYDYDSVKIRSLLERSLIEGKLHSEIMKQFES